MPISVVVQGTTGAPSTAEDAALWVEYLELTFPVLADPTGEFFAAWDPEGFLPVIFIIDQTGVVVWAEAGGTGGLDEIQEMFLPLLAR